MFLVLIITIILFFSSCTKIENEKLSDINIDHLSGQSKLPNVIFILGDDIGYEIPSCNGGQSYSTPNINTLAKKGTRFTQCYAMPTCSPSRIELMTGKYNFRNYIDWGILDTSQKTIGNIMKQAGYATCVAGKWQLDGGKASVKKFGFDVCSLFLPFYVQDEGPQNRYRYKSPQIYQNGVYLPDSATKDKYADDIFTKFVCNFIDSNRHHPFFIYYPCSLCHQPFSPTPDDADYAGWNPLRNGSDPKYFPSMVNYMDKKIGVIMNKLIADHLASNTIIIFAGDNGTPKLIKSLFNDTLITGGKSTSTVYGIHVPLIITQLAGNSQAGTVKNTLIDFTDFLSTLADIAKTKITEDYGITDGVSFYNALTGLQDSIRSSVFFHWQDYSYTKLLRWAQTSTYKLYDSTNNKFFDFATDPLEKKPIAPNQQTSQEKAVSMQLKNVLNTEHN